MAKVSPKPTKTRRLGAITIGKDGVVRVNRFKSKRRKQTKNTSRN